jgi:hypothetical protein
MPNLTDEQQTELAALRDRFLLILETCEREEPGPSWAPLRAIVTDLAERGKLRDLQTLGRELQGMLAGLTPQARACLDSELRLRFGEDADVRADAEAVDRIRARGAIHSEREYRLVHAYADALGHHPAAREEHIALGKLLDAYNAAPRTFPA